MALSPMAQDNVLPTQPYKTRKSNPFDPAQGANAYWLVDGVYDEAAAQLRIEKANADMAKDSKYAANNARFAIEKRLEQRALALDIAEYH